MHSKLLHLCCRWINPHWLEYKHSRTSPTSVRSRRIELKTSGASKSLRNQLNQLIGSAHVLWAFELLGSGAMHLVLGWTPHDRRFVLGNKMKTREITHNIFPHLSIKVIKGFHWKVVTLNYLKCLGQTRQSFQPSHTAGILSSLEQSQGWEPCYQQPKFLTHAIAKGPRTRGHKWETKMLSCADDFTIGTSVLPSEGFVKRNPKDHLVSCHKFLC